MTDDVKIAAHPYGYTAVVEDGDLYRAAEQIFSDLAGAGYDGIELMHTMLEPLGSEQEMLDLSRTWDIPVIGSSFGAHMWDAGKSDEILEAAERICEQLETLGAHQLAISTGSTGEPKTDEQLDTQAEVVREMVGICDERGLTLNVHNHTYEMDWDMHEFRGMLQRIPEMKLGPDLNWLRRAGVDPWAFVREYGDRIVYMHLRPQRHGCWVQTFGESDEDYTQLAAVIDEIDFTGWLGVELAFREENPVTRAMGQNYALCLEYLRAVLH
ncbi:MAG: sugar phosphate isomerase/epimerase family protein [Armatimonadota bacterium]